MVSLPADFRITDARAEDAGALRELRRAVLAEGCWFATRVEEYGATLEQVSDMIVGLLRQPNGFLLVARSDDHQVVGCLAVHGERLARMAHLGRLEMMVAAPWRGRGMGSALLDAAIARAEANPSLRKLSLAVFEDNQAATTLYANAGFVREGRRQGEYLFEDGTERADLLAARDVSGETR